MDPLGVQRRDGTACGGAETDDDGAAPRTEMTGDPGEAHRMQDRAVAGELVVLVEDVQAVVPAPRPVVHRLESDQGEAAVDRRLRHRRVLHAVGPAPQHTARGDLLDIGELRLGQEQHVGRCDHLVPLGDAAHARLDVSGLEREPGRVTTLDDHPGAEVRVDAVEVERMDRQAALVLHRGLGEHAEGEQVIAPSRLRGRARGRCSGRSSGAGHPASHRRGTGVSSVCDCTRRSGRDA